MAHRLTLLAACAVLGLTAAPAYAATGSPPVTAPNTVRLNAGEGIVLDVTANDTDPDGDELAVCRVGDDVPRKLEAIIDEGQLLVMPKARARGTYTFTYYACDSSYLTPGQVTVKVGPPRPTLEMIPLGAIPGRVRIVNHYEHQTFHCTWDDGSDGKVDGRATVRPGKTVVITLRETPASVVCESASAGYVAVFSDRSVVRQGYSAKASGGGQAHTRLRSP